MTSIRRKNGYCECGCGERTRIAPQSNTAKGWVRGEPLRFLRGHNAYLRRKSQEPFHETEDTNCWLWLRSTNPLGYGQMSHEGRLQPAYRVYYRELIGPIPDGLELDHLCREPGCVNPGHLEPVTHRENIVRAMRRTHCIHGHLLDEANSYFDKQGRRHCRACHREQERARYRRLAAA